MVGRPRQDAFTTNIIWQFLPYFTHDTYVVHAYWKRLNETFPISMHNIGFLGEVRQLEIHVLHLSGTIPFIVWLSQATVMYTIFNVILMVKMDSVLSD